MADVTYSNQMNLPIPVVGVDAGPDYATNVNNCLTIVDSHDHSAGYGVQITPNGLNISSDLTFIGNSATHVKSISFESQTAVLSPTGCIYEVNGDLYYNDGVGNKIRVTQGGAVTGAAGTITGLPSGTASASYATGTFTFQGATNTPATLDAGNVIVRNNTSGSKGVILAPTGVPGADYSLFLPSIPASTSFLQLDNAGNISAGPATVQGITASNIANGTITTTQIASATITGSNIASATITGSNVASATIAGSNIVSDAALTGQPTTDGAYIVTAHTNDSSAPQILAGGIGASLTGSGVGYTYSTAGGTNTTVTFTQSFGAAPFVTLTSTDSTTISIYRIITWTASSFTFQKLNWDGSAKVFNLANPTYTFFTAMGRR